MLRAIVVLVVVGASATYAHGQPRAQSPSTHLPNLQSWTLENGLEVAFLPLERAPSISVQLWYHVGAKDESPKRRGSAHMFEHMMFKGTQHLRAQDHARYINGLGGHVNAYTTEDVTVYQNTVPPESLDFVIQLEAERMSNLWLRDEMIAGERDVIKEEIRRQENSPLFAGFVHFLKTAFRQHPYAWTAAGNRADLDATTSEELKSFYSRYYVPNNALLVVVGNAKETAVRASVTKWFAPLKKSATVPRVSEQFSEKPQSEARRQVVAPAQVGVIMRGYHVPEAKHPDMHALRVLALILSGGQSSRLSESIVRRQKLAVESGGELLIREDPGLIVLFAAYLDSSKGAALEAALQAEVALVRRGRVSNAELGKAKKQLQAQLIYDMESVAGIAERIGNSWIHRGQTSHYLDDLSALESVSVADIKRVANLYLDDSKSIVVVIPPANVPMRGTR